MYRIEGNGIMSYLLNIRFVFVIAFMLLPVVTELVPPVVYAEEERSEKFAIPDVPEELLDSIKYRNDYWSMGVGLGVLVDYTAFSQDDESIAQVGRQENELEARSLRLLFGGTLDFIGPVSYLLATEFKNFYREGATPTIVDLTLLWKFRGRQDWISVGKQKEPFVYEMVGDAANLVQHERLLEPFFRSRNTGIKYESNFLNRRVGFSLGWYNDWWHSSEDFSDSGNQYVARLTGLPIWLDKGARFVHLGVSSRYVEGDDDVLSYRGRPGSNVSDYYVDSGAFTADHAWHMGLEALFSGYKFTILTEYAQARVESQEAGDPIFDGWYVATSYVINGGPRPYDQTAGYSRRVQPYTAWGALEPLFRFGQVDLDGGDVRGGKFDKWYLGLNWWATRRWKLSIGYGNIDLDRFGTVGNTKQVLLRLQWIG